MQKVLNIPESKGLLHKFKFDLEIPFAPIVYPKTLYYQLDQERHTRPKVLNADVKGMCNLFVTCDLGLPLDDLNMKPHIYNLQDTNSDNHQSNNNNNKDNQNNQLQLHPDDLALINEDIVVSDTEEDEETIKLQKEQKLLEQKIKQEQQKLVLESQRLQKESENAKEKDIDFTQSFEQLKLAIDYNFTASKNTGLKDIKHPTDSTRVVKRVFNILPNLSQEQFKLGIISHKSKVESLTNSLEKGKFSTLFKDVSFQDKNQKVFRLFIQKNEDEEPYKPKTLFEEDMIDIESEYNSLFQEDPEVVIEDQDNEQLNHNQIKLKNKSVFNYSDHSTKLQPNDTILLFSKENQNEQIQNAYYQKIEFQVSLDQERKELAVGGNLRQELGRYVKMDIIDEQQIKLMKQIDEELVEQEFGNQETKKQSKLQKTKKNYDEDDDEEDEDYGMDEEQEVNDEEEQDNNKYSKRNSEVPTKSYNLRESRKSGNFNQPSVEKKQSSVVEKAEEEEQLDDIFSDEDKENNAQGNSQNQNNNQAIEEEDDDEFHFQGSKGKTDEGQWTSNGKRKYKKQKEQEEEDDFINDNDDDEEEEEANEEESSHSQQRSQELKAFIENQQNQSTKQVQEEDDDEDDEEFPL